jgi:hypothetical protein
VIQKLPQIFVETTAKQFSVLPYRHLMRTIIAILLLLIVAACARESAQPVQTDVQNMQEPEYSASITYSGGFTPPEMSSTTVTAQDGKVTIATYDSTGAVGRIQERPVAEEAWAEFEDIVDSIDSLEPEYGQSLRGTIADAGIAEIAIMHGGQTLRTVVDPNVDDAYPRQLQALREWFAEQTAQQVTTDETLAVACTNPRPENCIEMYDPVCGDNGQTYGNGCVACADAVVNTYRSGEC